MIDFTNANGALFGILGKAGAVVANLTSHQNTQYTALTSSTTGINGQLTAEPDVQAVLGQGYLGMLASLGGSTGPLMQTLAAAVVNRIVYRDNPRLNQTLSSQETLNSLREVIRQMRVQSASVRACTVTSTPGTFTGRGNGVLVTSVKRPVDGLTLENTFSEYVNVICQADSFVGGATEGNETLSVTGGGGVVGVFDWNWPGGSGCQIEIQAADGSADNGSGNYLTNSGFDAFTGGIPDDWDVVIGTAGTDFQQNTGITYDGVSSLQFIGDGSTLVALWQEFGDSTDGTAASLSPLAQYALNGFLKRDGVAPGAGVMRFSLVDGNGVVIKDAAGVDNSFTVDLTALATDWAAYNGVFRTPRVLPGTYYLKVELTTALTSGRSVFLDRVALTPMAQCYVSGPYLACFSGNSAFAQDDLARITNTNGRGSGGTLNTWQSLLARLYPEVIQFELLFPSAASPSVLDSWIA